MRHELYLALATKLYFPVSRYFRFFAKIILKKWKPKTIVVMGSAGKSNAHNLFYQVIKSRFSIRKSQKANSAFGIPLDVLDIHLKSYNAVEWLLAAIKVPFKTFYLYLFPYKEKFYILELDVDRPNEMAFLSSFIKPIVVFWVSSYATHTASFEKLVSKGKFESEPLAVAVEFAKIFRRSRKTLALVNGDSQFISEAMKKYDVPKYLLKKDEGRYAFSKWEIFRKRTQFELKLGKNQILVDLPFIAPRNFGYTLLATYLLAEKLGIENKAVNLALSEFKFNPGICSILEGLNGSKIIDSSYNSSYFATISLLEVLANYPGRRKIAVLGDMRELGSLSGAEHTRLAEKLLEYRFDQVVLVGPEMTKYVQPLLAKEYTDVDLHPFQNSYQAGLFLKERLVKEGDVLLLKASQNTLMFEIIAELLLASPTDLPLLCRRDPVWETKRSQIKAEFYRSVGPTA